MKPATLNENKILKKYGIKSVSEKFLFITRNKIILPSGCWEIKSRSKQYVSIYMYGFSMMIHRISFAIYKNVKLKRDLVIDHVCTNKKCFNPDHLRQTTSSLNVSYAMALKYEKEVDISRYDYKYVKKETYEEFCRKMDMAHEKMKKEHESCDIFLCKSCEFLKRK